MKKKRYGKKGKMLLAVAAVMVLSAGCSMAKKPEEPTADAAAETVYNGAAVVPDGYRMADGFSADESAKNLGYLPLIKDSTGVIAVSTPDGLTVQDTDGLTNVGMAAFFRDNFFYITVDAAGRSVCTAYAPDTLEKTEVFHADRFPIIRAEKDGYVYYALRGDAADEKAVRFLRAATNGTDNADGFPVEVGYVANGAGTAELKQDLTDFVIDGNQCRYYAVKDGAVYAAAAKLTAEGAKKPELSQEAVETSVMNTVGRVTAEIGEAHAADPIAYQEQMNQAIAEMASEDTSAAEVMSTVNPDATLLRYYIETIDFDGDGDAAKKMTEYMAKIQQSMIAEAKEQGDEMAKNSFSFSHPAMITWRFSGTRGVTMKSENVLCIEGDRYEWTEEKVSRRKRYFTFDRATGEILTLADITSTPIETIQTLVGAAFRKKAEQSNFAYETPEGLEHTVADSIGLDSPFFLTDKGIGFFFEPGRIAADSEGFPEVVIPYDQFEMKIKTE